MLPEGLRELLTAYVDGELSARRRRHVLRLLRRSPEARRLLQRLQTDSRELQELPFPRLDRDLSPDVLRKVAARPRKSARRPVVRRFPADYQAWIGTAAAAAVLFLIGGASYCYFAAFLNRPVGPAVALRQSQESRPSVAPEVKTPVVPPTVAVLPPPHAAAEKHDPAPAPPVPVEVAHHEPADPTPPVVEKEDPVLTSEGMEMFVEIKSVATNLDVPATFKLRDLEQEAVHKKLVAELQKDAALRVELPVRDGTEAFKRLQTVLKAYHADLAIDAAAARRIARPPLHTNYVLYSEDLTAEELGRVLRQLGVEAKKDKRPADNPFDRLVVRRMTERDHKELSDLLGVDPVRTPPSKQKGPLGVDPRKPVADGTAAQLATTLAAPRPEPGKSAGKQGVNHPVLVLPYNPVRPRRDSAEIKRFLEGRKPMRSGALHVLLVLRGPTG